MFQFDSKFKMLFIIALLTLFAVAQAGIAAPAYATSSVVPSYGHYARGYGHSLGLRGGHGGYGGYGGHGGYGGYRSYGGYGGYGGHGGYGYGLGHGHRYG